MVEARSPRFVRMSFRTPTLSALSQCLIARQRPLPCADRLFSPFLMFFPPPDTQLPRKRCVCFAPRSSSRSCALARYSLFWNARSMT